MRVPWKLIKARSMLWIFLSLVCFYTILLNVFSLTLSDMLRAEIQCTQYIKPVPKEDIGIGESPHSVSERTTLPWRDSTNFRPRGKEIQHIAFLKLHKAASTTVQTIFLRFGWYRNLTFVLPPAKNPTRYPHIISLNESLTHSNILPPPKDKSYDIMCNHVFYNYDAFRYFMPKDSVIIGILRDPFELCNSILDYFRPKYIFKKIQANSPASEFLRNPSIYEPKRLFQSWTNNRMAIEYGFPEDVIRVYDQKRANEYIKKLDREFKVILIAEYLEESVIIMRRYLNWQTKDIIFTDKNISMKKNESMLFKTSDRDIYKRYAKVDYDLYTYFYRRLKEQIRKEGVDFDDELLHFKELRKTVSGYCKQTEVDKPVEIYESRWGEAFSVTKADCIEMWRIERDFITRIRVRQYGTEDI